jgi:serine phosphatase RsbU (regulator of sigma subunit)/CHASE2 domain-containing sensor protein
MNVTLRSLLARAAPAGGSWLAPLALVVVIVLHLLGLLPFQDTLRTLSFDLYQRLVPRERVSAPVVIVDIDEASLEKLGQWPWPRNLTARMLERIWRAEPAAVALDILMPEVDRTSACQITQYVPAVDPTLLRQVCALPSNDALLAASLRQGKAVLGVAGIDGESRGTPRAAPVRVIGDDPRDSMRHFDAALTNLPELEDAAAGHAILSTDIQHGAVRRVPMVANVAGTILPSLSLETLRVATGSSNFVVKASARRIEGVGVKDLFIPTQEDGSLWVHYSHHDRARYVSAATVLDGSLDPEVLRQKLVLVGLSGLGLVDFYSTALGERMPGVEIHAQVLESIFDGTTLLRPRWALWLEGILMLAVGLSVSWLFPRMRARVLMPLMLLATILLAIGGLAAYARAHLLIDVFSPISIFVVMFGFMLASLLIREELQRKTLESDLQVQREQAAKVRGEMEAARRIQMGILPDVREKFVHESRLDIAAQVEPAKQVGGDLYDCFMLDEHRAFFAIGDVCGKGVPASLFMAISKTLCKSLALRVEPGELDPGALVRQANMEISRDNPEMLFVTAFVGVLDLRTGELSYCNAGHDRPLVFAPGSAPRELGSTRAPAICVVENFAYQTNRQRLTAGEFLCVFTDGVTEAFNPAEEAYGKARLDAVLRGTHPDASARQILDAVSASVHAFATGAEQSDDLTLMVLRWRPDGIPISGQSGRA